MTAKESLYSIIAPIFNGEFHPNKHPDADGAIDIDYAVYSSVGGELFKTLKGKANLQRPRFQVSVYALNYDSLCEKVKFVEAAMSIANDAANAAIDLGQDPYDTIGAQLNQQVSMAVDGYEADTKRHYAHLDFYCWERI